MPNSVDTNLFQHKDCENAEIERIEQMMKGGRFILHVGRKTEEKNADTVIQALNYLDREVKCIFIGEGDVEKYLGLAEKAGVKDRCCFLKSIQNRVLP